MTNYILFDFNSDLYFDHSFHIGVVNEHWKNRFRSTARTFPLLRIFQMCRSISRRIQSKNVFVSEPVFSDGICPTHSTGKSPRYRNLLAGHAIETVPHRLSREYLPQHTRECKFTERLANIFRLRTYAHYYGPSIICERRLRRSTEKDGVCTRFNHHRSMPVIIPMGKVPKTQSRSQNAYAHGSSRQHSFIHPDYQWCCSRRKYFRFSSGRSRCILSARSRIPGFFPTPQHSFIPSVLYHSHQSQFPASTRIFTSGEKIFGNNIRSDRHAHRILLSKKISGQTSPYSLLRQGFSTAHHLSDEQLLACCNNDRPAVQMSVADRAVLQMDQAASSHQSILWNFVQCRQDTAVDRDCYIRSGSYSEETYEHRCAPLQHITGFKRHIVRKTTAVTGAFRAKCRN